MTYENKLDIDVRSEIGKLEGVILHTPGIETENMTPGNAERALYSDILNLNVSLREYQQLSGVLDKVTTTFQMRGLLRDILENPATKEQMIGRICRNECIFDIRDKLLDLDADELSKQLIEGVILEKNNLTKYLSKERYSLRPLHNFFYMRDASVSVLNRVLISKMASNVRMRESIIMESIFTQHPIFNAEVVNPVNELADASEVTIEGGDVLIAREDIMLIGVGGRTTSQGVDFILERLKQKLRDRHIIIQELPLKPESFIHLDMVFTLLDKDKCMVYEPVILQPNKFQTVHIEIKDGKVKSIQNKTNLLTALKDLGMDLEPVYCGGTADRWTMDREQWHSGANFFAFAPGKVIGYERNVHTVAEMNKHGFEVLKAVDVIAGKVHPDDYKRCVVTIEGSELARGGGGARCMTMPIRRAAVDW
jgi:arginine deiminase